MVTWEALARIGVGILGAGIAGFGALRWFAAGMASAPDAAAVRAVAAERGDLLQTITPGRDGVHPRSYRALMRAVRARLGS